MLTIANCRFYGGTESLVDAYKSRGIESFGIIEFGSCGYTLSDGTLAYPRDMYAALAGERLVAMNILDKADIFSGRCMHTAGILHRLCTGDM